MKSIRLTIRLLLFTAIGLPIIYLALHLISGLLIAMGDDRGAEVVRGFATACAAAWPVVLAGLLLTMAYEMTRNEPPGEKDEPL